MTRLLTFVLLGSAAAAFGRTPEPYLDVEFTVTEGTWMSVDVSPDGRVLVFDLLGDIYRLPVEGGEAVLVHGGTAMQHSPRFRPDGTRILYLSDESGADNLWASDVDGGGARQVTRETLDILSGPGWGADFESFVASRTVATFPKMYSSEIRLFDLQGSPGRVLVETPKSGRDVGEACLSPDGRFLYYTERVRSPDFVYVDWP